MPYIEEICVAGNVVEVNKYYSFRCHAKGEKRCEKENETTDAQKRINQRKAEKELRRSMNANFVDGDYLIRLDFFKRPPGSVEMQRLISAFIRKLRTALRKLGIEIKYIYVKEVGPRGGRHIHMMLTKCDTDIIRKLWTHGGIHIDPLNSNGQYGKIASYFIKYANRTEETEGRIIGKRWCSSQNLEKPKVVKKVISANEFRKDIKKNHKKAIENGEYILDKDTLRSGVSDETGYGYFTYTLIRTESKRKGG